MKYLLLFLLLFLKLDAQKDIAIHVTKDKKSISLKDELSVTIDVNYKEGDIFNLFPFMLNLANEEMDGLEIETYEIESPEKAPTKINLKLKPRISGSLIFAPGIASFSKPDFSLEEYLVPAFSIECAPPQTKLEIVDLLPFYPESQITMNAENRQKVFLDSKLLEREKLRNQELYAAHASAWTYLIAFLLGLGVLVLLFWVIFEVEYLRSKIVKPTPKRNFRQEFNLLAENKDESGNWSKLSLLIREALSDKENRLFTTLTTKELLDAIQSSSFLSDHEKSYLKSLFRRLESIEFAGEKASENEWITVIQDLRTSSAFT